MMNRLQSMEVFVAVVERNSFSRASHALRMAPSTVSLHIAKLESDLGVNLLNRTTRAVALSDEGRKYYALCKRVLTDIADVESSLIPSRSSVSGRLQVDVNDSVMSKLLQPLLPEFLARYPSISLNFTNSGHNFDAHQLGADIMIRMPLTPFDDSRLIATPIGYTKSVCAATPGYLARHGEPATPADLHKHHCIGYIDSWSGRHWEWIFEHNGEQIAVDVPHRLAYGEGHLRVDAAIQGLGIITDLACSIKEPLQNGQLQPILTEWTWTPPPYHILYRQNFRRSRKIKAFVNFVLEKYPPDQELDPPI